MTLGQVVSFAGVLVHWNALSDAYSVFKYFALAVICLGFACNTYPRQGLLTVSALGYLIALTMFSLLAWDQTCFIGRRLNYFTGVLPMALVAVCYHYSIGDKVERISNAFIAACVIAALVSIGQSYSFFLPQGDYFGGRVYACMGNPVFLSGAMAMAIPLCLGRTYTPLAIPLIITAILLTQSRSGLVASAAGVLAYLFHQGRIGIKMACVLAIGFMLLTVGMFSGLRNTSKTDLGRYHLARVAVITVLDNPLGVGPEMFGKAMVKYRDNKTNLDMGDHWSNAYVHNSLLEALVTGGPLFLLIHLCFMLAVGAFAYRHANSAVFGASCAVLAFGLAQPTPLVLKASLAALLGASDPSDKPIGRGIFILASIAAFIASLACVTMAKIHYNGVYTGQAQMVLDSYKYQPSAKGD